MHSKGKSSCFFNGQQLSYDGQRIYFKGRPSTKLVNVSIVRASTCIIWNNSEWLDDKRLLLWPMYYSKFATWLVAKLTMLVKLAKLPPVRSRLAFQSRFLLAHVTEQKRLILIYAAVCTDFVVHALRQRLTRVDATQKKTPNKTHSFYLHFSAICT